MTRAGRRKEGRDMAEERIEDRPDDDTTGNMPRRHVSNEEPGPAPEDDVEGARRRFPGLAETEEDVEGHHKR
jgi:hypothetical protein